MDIQPQPECSPPCEPGSQHSPPLPAIAVGRRAFSPTYRKHGTIEEIGRNYSLLRLDEPSIPRDWFEVPNRAVMVLTSELVPVE
jgi:hypothetical protein